MFFFYTPWKHQKNGGFLMILGSREVEHSFEFQFFVSIFEKLEEIII